MDYFQKFLIGGFIINAHVMGSNQKAIICPNTEMLDLGST